MLSKERVLLFAEDEIALQDAIVDLLGEMKDVKILRAKDGQESYDILCSQAVDAVLSDIKMPKMTGLEVLKKIREKGIDVPYVILSGFGDKSNIAQALAFAATDFLEKPFDDDHLIATVDKALDLGRAFRNLIEEIKKLVDEKKISQQQYETIKAAKIALTQIRFNNKLKVKAS